MDMNIDKNNAELQDRKKNFLKRLQEEHPPHKQAVWEVPGDIFITTAEYSKRVRDYTIADDIVAVKYRINKLLGLGTTVMIIFVAGFFYIHVLAGIAVMAIASSLFIKRLNRENKLIIDKNGIWCYQWKMALSWEKTVATYIKMTTYSEGAKGFSLVAYYYHAFSDDFRKLEYRLDDLDLSERNIAFAIEHFRNRNAAGVIS
jgi:hypothetical protein